MSAYKIKFDKKRCIACHACEVHCKVKNTVPAGLQLNHIFVEGPKPGKDGKPVFQVKYQPCFMCKEPKCVPACPTGAMTKRESDGLVYVQSELCDGCKSCIEACPWSVPVFNEAVGKVIKCDYCMDRLAEGLEPACVVGCTGKALSLVKTEE